jgi:transposase
LIDYMPPPPSRGRHVEEVSPSSSAARSEDLLKAGRTVRQVAFDLQISDQTIYNWREQDLIDTGQKPGLTSSDHTELVAARRRIAELETELAVTRRAAELLTEAVLAFPPGCGHPVSCSQCRHSSKLIFVDGRG